MSENLFKKYMQENYCNDQLQDIANHGCASGCATTLIYYSDTSKIYDLYCDDIHAIVGDYMESTGICDFKTLNESIGSAMQFKNAIVWLAAELVAYDLVSEFIA